MGDTLTRSYLTRCPQCGSAVAPDTRPVVMKIADQVFTMERTEDICPVCFADMQSLRETQMEKVNETDWLD